MSARFRLTVALPVVAVGVVAAGFAVVAASMPEPTDASSRAALDAASRTLALWAVVTATASGLVAWLLARLIVKPLDRIRRQALRPGEPAPPRLSHTVFHELHAVAWGLHQLHQEYASRLGRAAAEQSELEALVEAVSEGLIQVSPDGTLVKANPAAVELLALPDDAEGQPVGTVVRNARLRETLGRAVRSGTMEAREVALDDRRLLVTADPLDGGGIVVTLMDLTTVRRLEEVRRDFVANASHELKTPLTSIRGYTETILHADLPESDRRMFLTTISRNAERLQRIVDDLLDLSRLESGKWRPGAEAVDLADAAAACWRSQFEDAGRERDIHFDVAQPDGLAARADAQALDQIFANLLSNALRYAPDGGHIAVSVSVCDDPVAAITGAGGSLPSVPRRPGEGARLDEEEHWVLVEVRDDGTGIPQDALSRIFERFYRVDPARSRAEGGTGLGLSIVRHLVESMGGTVWAESELGKGTAVRFLLPRSGGPPGP